MVHMYTCVVGSHESDVWVKRLCGLIVGTPRGIKGSYGGPLFRQVVNKFQLRLRSLKRRWRTEVSLRVKLRHCDQRKTSHDSIPSLGLTGKVDDW